MAERLNMASDSINDEGDSSDIIYESPCKPCSDEGTSTEGVCICFQCQTCFCEGCVGYHNKCFKTHSLFYKTFAQSQSIPQTSSDLTCDKHPGNVIQMYCGEHDHVTCAVCIAVDHRICKGVDYIPKLTKEILNGRDRRDVKTSLEKLKQDLKAARAYKVEENDRVSSEKESNLNEIKSMTERIITRAKKLEETTVKDVQEQYDTKVDTIRTEIKFLDEMISSTDTHIKKIDQYKGNNEAKLFVLLHKANDRELECRKYLEGDGKFRKGLNAKMSFQINHDIESALNTVKSLVMSDSAKFDYPCYDKTIVCEFSHVADFNVKEEGQETACCIVDFCILDDNTMVVVDGNNKKLIRLDQGYNLKDWVYVGLGYPKGLCKTGPNELALGIIYYNNVRFVYVGRSMVLTRSFDISTKKMHSDMKSYDMSDLALNHIAFSKDTFFILASCSFKKQSVSSDRIYEYVILLYDVEGCHLQTIFTDLKNTNINHFSLSQDRAFMFLAMDDKVITLSKDGSMLFEVTNERLKYARHVSEIDNGQILVCGRDSGNLLLVDRDGKVVSEVLGRYDGLSRPISSFYIRDQKRLLVACEKEDIVKIFQL